jgi:hypothetical protein
LFNEAYSEVALLAVEVLLRERPGVVEPESTQPHSMSGGQAAGARCCTRSCGAPSGACAEATPPRASNAKKSRANREASFRFIVVLLWVPSQLHGEGWRRSMLQVAVLVN